MKKPINSCLAISLILSSILAWQPPAVISALAVPYVDRQYCVHLCWRSA
jgi:hypothetical protein